MKKVDNIFVVLTYRNTEDLKEFIQSVNKNVKNYKIIIINSFYDEESKIQFEKIAREYNCDFLNIENKGYSYGNNRGIEYANQYYDYKFLIISNPDIIIRRFSTSRFHNGDIFCGYIKTRDNKMQNPMLVKENKISDYLIYRSYIKKKKIYFILGILINKVIRNLYLIYMKFCNRDFYRIFQAHGCFIVFSRKSIDDLREVFDEKIFLFGEEGILAQRCKRKEINIYFTPYISCYHKEDGSMRLSNRNLNLDYKESNIYYYEKYCKKK